MPLLKLLRSDKDVRGQNEEERGPVPLLEPFSDNE